MSDIVEIEAKALISKEDYEKLVSLFKENRSYVQINYYIDTKDSDVRKKGLSLRVRFKDMKFEMTVKVPRTEGHIEKNVYITDEEFEGINGQGEYNHISRLSPYNLQTCLSGAFLWQVCSPAP